MLLSYKPLHLEAQQRLQEEGFVVDISGLCRWSRTERSEEREREAQRLFPETENVRRVPGYNAAIV